MIKISDVLKSGAWISESALDTKVKPLFDMQSSSKVRHGYSDSEGWWTPKGYARATSSDLGSLDAFNRWFQNK